MTSEEKKTVYTLLKTVSSNLQGYTSPAFSEEMYFEDDFVEVIENTKPVVNTAESRENAAVSVAASTSNSTAPDAAPVNAQTSGSTPVNAPVPGSTQVPLLQKEAVQKISGGVTLDSIALKISSCKKCLLSSTRKNTVPGEGVINPLVLVIGEGPGEDEDKTGRPFVGKAGQLLDKMLAAISLRRDLNCFIANIVKCRPPMNRTPMKDEAVACSGFLQAQIHVLKPKMILAMGRCAIQNLLDTESGINSLRGKFFEYNGIPLLATYHPSALLRDPALKAPAWSDLKTFRARLSEIAPGYEEDFRVLQRDALR